eukprot:Lithocolla_globosa_v1_NODE_127_length_6020_cov_51.448114.p1 type:complete len:867 gc:universal NODE_127_length_6020_cov_51.448114:3658-1058(-)
MKTCHKIQDLKRKNNLIFITGDGNAHHHNLLGSTSSSGKTKTDKAGKELNKLIIEASLKQLVTENTYFRNKGSATSVIDIVLSDHPNLIESVEIKPPISSDSATSPHPVIESKLTIVPKLEPQLPRKVWLYKKADFDGLRSVIKETNWDESFCSGEADKAANFFTQKMRLSMEKFIPSKQIVTNPKDQPWWNDECTFAHDGKCRAFKKFKVTQNSEDLKKKELAEKKASHVYKTAQEEYRADVEREIIDSKGDPKAWWSIIDRVTAKGSHASIPVLEKTDNNGNIFTADTNKDKAEMLNALFVEKATVKDEGVEVPEVPKCTIHSVSKVKFRVRTILRLLKQMKVKQATGPDNIPARVLKECAEVLAPILARLFQLSFDSGVFPSLWKIAHVVPVYKHKGESSDPSMYRPISLLSIVGKTMEKVINSTLRKHLFGFKLISHKQYGFRPKCSTVDLLTATTQRWINDMKDYKEIRLVALDISRAFDAVWHKGLLVKLKSYGIEGNLLRWLSNFLSDRSQCVILNGETSSRKRITAGVPQGSILSPTLFIVFIDDIVGTVENNLEMFADDTTLHKTVENSFLRCQVAYSLQSDLDKIEKWANTWLVSYNATKTEVLTISRKKDVLAFPPSRWHPPYAADLLLHPTLTFFGERLREVTNIKLLGVTLTETLDWGKHIENVAKKGSKSMGILQRAKKYCDSESRAVLYKAFIRSKLEYCSPLWIGGSGLDQLDRIQRRCCRILGFPHKTVVPSLNIQSLEHRRLVSGLCLYYRMWSNVAPPDVCSLLPLLSSKRHSPRFDRVPQRVVVTSNANYQQSSFVNHFTRVWNLLPSEILTTPKHCKNPLQDFKKKTNRLELEQLSISKPTTHSR